MARRFTGSVWTTGDQGQSRVDFSILADSWDDAVALLKETYGVEVEFNLVDEEAANRIR